MAKDIQGFIEINTINYSEKNHWHHFMDISKLIERACPVYGILFDDNENKKMIIYTNRNKKDSSNKIPGKSKKNNSVGNSQILYPEVKANINRIPLSEYTWGWSFIFDTMKKLSSEYGNDNVRLVADFNH